jgi:hypothetical protein
MQVVRYYKYFKGGHSRNGLRKEELLLQVVQCLETPKYSTPLLQRCRQILRL